MRNLIYRAANRLRGFMYGRYGLDYLSISCLIGGFVLSYLGSPSGFGVLNIIALVLYGIGLFRCLSRNIEKRRREEEFFSRFWRNFKASINSVKNRIKDKDHRYIRCSKCKTLMRVPKNRGKIRVTCPGCGEQKVIKS